MSPDHHDPHPLAPDDPRLSEWLDGRLTVAEAAEIERLVAASPELTRLVADLRGMRGALGAVPVTPPPVGFVRDVLAAIDAVGDEAGDEAEVEEEWRRIERQRLEGEIAEAADDAAEPVPEPMRQRWPWLALAGALAAGVLVAVAINPPGGPGDREVALVNEAQAQKRSPAARPAVSADENKQQAEVADTWLEEAADKVPAEARALAAGANREQEAEAAKSLADRAAAPAAPTAAAITASNAAGQAADAAEEPRVRRVTYRIRTAADRRRLDDLVAASGGVQQRALDARAEEQVRRKAAAAEAKADRAAAAEQAVREGGPVTERIVLSGPAGTLASLAAALETAPVPGAGFGTRGAGEALNAGLGRSATTEQAGAAATPAAKLETAKESEQSDQAQDGQLARLREAESLLVIEIVDESGANGGEGGP